VLLKNDGEVAKAYQVNGTSASYSRKNNYEFSNERQRM
jgi:hypothetical protein